MVSIIYFDASALANYIFKFDRKLSLWGYWTVKSPGHDTHNFYFFQN